MHADRIDISLQLPGFLDRFWANVDRSEKCWLWTGTTDRDGYGRITMRSNNRRGTYEALAHRVAWTIETGSAPGRALICHRCDTAGCVRALHLFSGTSAENVRDAIRKDRFGHVLRAADVQAIRTRLGSVPQRVLAAEYGVSASTIGMIATRRIWAHLD